MHRHDRLKLRGHGHRRCPREHGRLRCGPPGRGREWRHRGRQRPLRRAPQHLARRHASPHGSIHSGHGTRPSGSPHASSVIHANGLCPSRRQWNHRQHGRRDRQLRQRPHEQRPGTRREHGVTHRARRRSLGQILHEMGRDLAHPGHPVRSRPRGTTGVMLSQPLLGGRGIHRRGRHHDRHDRSGAARRIPRPRRRRRHHPRRWRWTRRLLRQTGLRERRGEVTLLLAEHGLHPRPHPPGHRAQPHTRPMSTHGPSHG
ncbi:hypothetical protein WA016_04769 [Myxococcus stipitatus]